MFKIDTDKLARLREQKSISVENLAQVTGVHVKSLEKMERTGFASDKNLKAVCSILGIRAKEIILPMSANPWF